MVASSKQPAIPPSRRSGRAIKLSVRTAAAREVSDLSKSTKCGGGKNSGTLSGDATGVVEAFPANLGASSGGVAG